MKHKCIVCKKEKGTKGLSFHRFPKDEKQLHLWLRNLEKENCTPSPSSLVCSRHFEPECLQRIFNRVRLKKDSIPTVFTEQSLASIGHESLSGSEMHVLKTIATSNEDATSCTEVQPLIEPHNSYTESPEVHVYKIIATSNEDATFCTEVQPLIEPHNSYTESSEVYVHKIIATSNEDATSCTEVQPLIKPHDSCTESSEMHVPEIAATSSKATTPCIESMQQVQHDHQYSYTPKSYRKKLHDMQKHLHELRNSEQILKQKVKRLQTTVKSLKQVVNPKNPAVRKSLGNNL